MNQFTAFKVQIRPCSIFKAYLQILLKFWLFLKPMKWRFLMAWNKPKHMLLLLQHWIATSEHCCFQMKIASFCKKKIQNQMSRKRIRMDVFGFKFNIKIASFDLDKKPLYESFSPFFRLPYFHIEIYKHKFILLL